MPGEIAMFQNDYAWSPVVGVKLPVARYWMIQGQLRFQVMSHIE